jgi:hypothetical protein
MPCYLALLSSPMYCNTPLLSPPYTRFTMDTISRTKAKESLQTLWDTIKGLAKLDDSGSVPGGCKSRPTHYGWATLPYELRSMVYCKYFELCLCDYICTDDEWNQRNELLDEHFLRSNCLPRRKRMASRKFLIMLGDEVRPISGHGNKIFESCHIFKRVRRSIIR